MKIVAAIVGVGAVIGVFAFQNCNKVPTGDSLQSSEPSVTKYNLPVDDISNVTFYVSDITTVNKAGKTYSLKFNKTLKLDIDSGELVETNDINADTATYCLPESVRQELVSIFQASQVCKSQPPESPELACTQVFKLPYCEVTVGEDITALGSASDGCGHNSVDLCESQNTVLKTFIQKLNQSYTTYKCNAI